jgi:phosphoribosylanthranilate isomerase
VNPAIHVKICGITNRDDALAAIDAGADALGFNLFHGSKRHVRLEQIAPWLSTLGGGALRVAVLVNPSIEEIRRVQPLFDVVQLHGQETPALCVQAAVTGVVWKAFPLTAALDAGAVAPFQARALVIDSSTPGAFGGTGVLIDLDRAALFVSATPGVEVWLSGGLHPGNVADAVKKVRPFGVDVASGVELPGDPRRKDAQRLRTFIAAARQDIDGL